MVLQPSKLDSTLTKDFYMISCGRKLFCRSVFKKFTVFRSILCMSFLCYLLIYFLIYVLIYVSSLNAYVINLVMSEAVSKLQSTKVAIH